MPGSYSLPSGRGPMGPVDEPNAPRPGTTGRTGGIGAVPSGGGGGGLGVGSAGGVTGVTYSGDGFKVGAGRMRGGGTGVGTRIKFAKGGKASSASKRADGCAKKGKTRGKMV